MARKVDLKAAKRRLKYGKQLLILLCVYKKFGVEFTDSDEALEFARKMYQWEEVEKEEY